ncbi:NAD kinase-like [Halichondria panicea]|uniref:NAD kinase-like n=1 Tax=Halichondria panicea TaxID=6063 RepID=UPI00312BC714
MATSDKKIEAKKRQLLSMKYNQRSQVDFSDKRVCGPKAQLLENSISNDAKTSAPGVELLDPSCEYHLVWRSSVEKILVIKKFRDVEVTRKFMELTTWLVEERGLTVIVEPAVLMEGTVRDSDAYSNTRGQLISWEDGIEESQVDCLCEADLIVCIGGDGTLLYTSSLFQESIPPIVSFHMGSLGFLAPFQFTKTVGSAEKNIYQDYLDKALKGGVSLTMRLRIECSIVTDHSVTTKTAEECLLSPDQSLTQNTFSLPRKKWNKKLEMSKGILVMNDLVVDRGPNAYLSNLIVYCNEREMTSVQGDGIIIATPTGSTAYSLAAGASMVHPSVPCMLMTPICPHSLSFRSIVVPAGVELKIKVAPGSRNSAWVSFDGRNRQEIKQGDSVVITMSEWAVPCVNNTGHVTDWFDSLAECLHWNQRKEQKKFNP